MVIRYKLINREDLEMVYQEVKNIYIYTDRVEFGENTDTLEVLNKSDILYLELNDKKMLVNNIKLD